MKIPVILLPYALLYLKVQYPMNREKTTLTSAYPPQP